MAQLQGVVHYSDSPMDERYDDFNTHSRPAVPPTSRSGPPTQQAGGPGAPVHNGPVPGTARRRIIVEVPMETDYDASRAGGPATYATVATQQFHSSLNSQVPVNPPQSTQTGPSTTSQQQPIRAATGPTYTPSRSVSSQPPQQAPPPTQQQQTYTQGALQIGPFIYLILSRSS